MITESDWLSYFPKPHPRPQQSQAISEILSFFTQNLYEPQVFLLDAPTGIGKSAIGMTVAKYFHALYQLTTNYVVHNKFLEQQLIADFPEVKHTYGRSNFRCIRNGESCDKGHCVQSSSVNTECEFRPIKEQMPDHIVKIHDTEMNVRDVQFDVPALKQYYQYSPIVQWVQNKHCPYWDTKIKAIQSPIAIHNYNYFLLEANYISDFGNRFLLICDEGHKLEDIIMNYIGFTITQKELDDFGVPVEFVDCSLGDWIEKVKKISEYLHSSDVTLFINDQLKRLQDSDSPFETEVVTKARQDFEQKMQSLLSKLKNMRFLDDQNWVIITKEEPDNTKLDLTKATLQSVTFKPIKISPYTISTLFQYGVKILIMSATLLSQEKITETLGLSAFNDLEVDRIKFVSLPSPFPIENRPFTYIPVGSLNWKNTEIVVELMLPIIRQILDKFPQEKGIIHTKSYKLAELIRNKLQNPRILIHDSKTRYNTLQTFLNDKTKHYVMTSPSIEEGVDLYDDRCRFIIILKIPYLDLGDEQIKKRMNQDPDWYNWKTIQTIIQEAGRGVRHEKDYCNTYLLDANFSRLLTNYPQYFPQWFMEALHEVTVDDFILLES